MKSLDFLKEGFVEDATNVHLDHEVQMAREECYHAAEHALAIHKLLRNVTEQQGLEGWVSSKITLANDYLNTVREHLEYELLQGNANDIDSLAIGMPIAETSDYARRREREENIISGKKPARRRAPAQTSDYARRREQEKKAEKGVAEGSEWETRHDEFTTVGDRATREQINKIVSALSVAAKQASSKRGFLNQIFGKQSNGDLARMAYGAEILAKNIQRNSNAKPGTDERKELGQHLVYAVSLLKRMNGEQGVAEGNRDYISGKDDGIDPETYRPRTRDYITGKPDNLDYGYDRDSNRLSPTPGSRLDAINRKTMASYGERLTSLNNKIKNETNPAKIRKLHDRIKQLEREYGIDESVAEGRRDVRYHQVYGDPGENPNMRRNDYTVRDLRYGSRTYYDVPPDQEDLARRLHMIQDKEGKWFLPDFPNLSTDDTLQLLATADSYFGRGEYFPAKRFMEPAWQTESKNTKARALAEWRKAERAKRMKEQTAGGITDTEIQQRIEPKNQNLPTDPTGMRAAGLVPAQDYDASIAAADAQNKALGSAQRSGFPTYQHQGKTFGVMNPKYGKGGTTGEPKPLTPQQIQQTAGTNIVSGSGAPVTAGHKMLTPGQRMGGMNETTAGSVAGVVNPKSTKPKSQVGSLFGGTYKQKVKKNGK